MNHMIVHPLISRSFERATPPNIMLFILSSLLILWDVVYPLLYRSVELSVRRSIGS